MDSFSFLMIQARLEYYEDMASRLQKEAQIRGMKKQRLEEKRRRIQQEACTDRTQAHILRAPLGQANE